ncbi:uncharacterized protein LOC143933290 [Lithobates pipiens]
MSLIRSTALLLLCAIVTLANAQSTCPEIGGTAITTSRYTVNVSASSITSDLVYTVYFTSTNSTNGTVLLQVLSNNTPVGNWSSLPNGFVTCTGGIWGNFSSNDTSFTAKWTSPTLLNSTSIKFSALINDTNGAFQVYRNVSVAALTSTASTNTNTVTATMATNTTSSTNTTSFISTTNSTSTPSTSNTTSFTNTTSTPSTASTSNTTSSTNATRFTSTASSTNTTTSTASSTIHANSTNTANGTTATTVTTKTATTSGGPANHLAPMFFTLMETLFFLVVTSKFLS